MTFLIYDRISAARRHLEAFRADAAPSEIVETMAELWKFCVSIGGSLSESMLRHVVEQHQAFFRPLQRAMESAWELEFVRSFETASPPDGREWLLRHAAPYLARTRRHVAEELKLLAEGLRGPAVIIGCGARPDSAICLKESGRFTRVVGVDSHPVAVRLARAVTDHVEFQVADGATFDFKEFIAVLIGNLVAPKADVLDRVRRICRSDALVLVRCPAGLGELFFEPITDWRGWQIIGRTAPNWPLLNQTFVLRPG
jgi:hypothetical protein